MSPQISVIMPLFNGEAYLAKAIESILCQSFKNFELIVVDDGSNDFGYEILKRYQQTDDRITIYQTSHKGAGSARNFGLEKASGKYVMFLDADDFFHRNMLSVLYQKAIKASAQITFCGFYITDESGQQKNSVVWDINRDFLKNESVFNRFHTSENLFNLTPGMVWNKLYDREFLLKNQIRFKNTTTVNDLFFKCAAESLADKITCIDRRLIFHRMNSVNALSLLRENSSDDTARAIKDIEIFLRKKHLWRLLEHTFRKMALENICHSLEIRPPVRCFVKENYFDHLFVEYELWDTVLKKDVSPNVCQKILYESCRQNKASALKDFYLHRKNRIIPVVFATDEQYAPYAAVALQSIIENKNNNYFYDIYVLHTSLSENTAFDLESMTGGNVRVSTLNITPHLPHNVNLYNQDFYTREMFYRFFICDCFAGYDKIIYLDCDIIVQTDLVELFETDLQDKAVAGVVMPLVKTYLPYLKKLKLHPSTYINSGVLVFNVPVFQKLHIKRNCLNLIKSAKTYKAPDQDILNLVCQNHVFYLDNKYNQRILYTGLDPESFETAPQQSNNALIFHYAFHVKPWHKPQENNFRLWWQYAKHSLFYERILEQNIYSQQV